MSICQSTHINQNSTISPASAEGRSAPGVHSRGPVSRLVTAERDGYFEESLLLRWPVLMRGVAEYGFSGFHDCFGQSWMSMN